MGITKVDLDDNALREAMRVLKVRTKSETVNEALRAVVRWRQQTAEPRLDSPAEGGASRNSVE